MNIVLLSPYFPSNYYNFAVALSWLGVNVLAIGDMPYDEMHPALRDALTEYYLVNNLHDYDKLVRACGYFTHRYGKLDRFESHNEYWLEVDARIRTDFNLPGPKIDEMAQVKYKSKMKRVFEQAGVAVAPGRVVRTMDEAQTFLAEVGYPVVAKPDNGVGAAATYKIRNAADLETFFAEKPPLDYFMEGFISGDLYSFDGLTDQDGEIVFYTSHYFNQGIMEVVNEGLDMYYYSLREIPSDLEEAGFRTVQAFGLRERFFHIEFFRTDKGLVALELNMRPPGGLTMDMFNYANDISLYQQWANVVVNNAFTADYARPYHCAYVGRKWHRSHCLSHDDVLAKYPDFLVHHEPINAMLAPAIGEYGYLLRSPELPELQAVINEMIAIC
jgi:hypothetical protein